MGLTHQRTIFMQFDDIMMLYLPCLSSATLLFPQTDRAAMLDEIVDYVKFLRLQVKVK